MKSKTLGIYFNKIVSSERVGDLANPPRDPSIIQLSRESPGAPGARGLYRGLLLSVRLFQKHREMAVIRENPELQTAAQCPGV